VEADCTLLAMASDVTVRTDSHLVHAPIDDTLLAIVEAIVGDA
jgi:hypothetical protein